MRDGMSRALDGLFQDLVQALGGAEQPLLLLGKVMNELSHDLRNSLGSLTLALDGVKETTESLLAAVEREDPVKIAGEAKALLGLTASLLEVNRECEELVTSIGKVSEELAVARPGAGE